MDIQKCVYCGRTVAPELPHYVVNGIQICLRCGGYKTLSNLAATGAGFSVVMEEPVEVGLPGQTYPPRIEVENVDGELVEKEPENTFDFSCITYGRSVTPDDSHPAYLFSESMREVLSAKFGANGEGVPEECKKAGHMNLYDFFTEPTADYLLSGGTDYPRFTTEEEKPCEELNKCARDDAA